MFRADLFKGKRFLVTGGDTPSCNQTVTNPRSQDEKGSLNILICRRQGQGSRSIQGCGGVTPGF